jgi:hypothetical protein
MQWKKSSRYWWAFLSNISNFKYCEHNIENRLK